MKTTLVTSQLIKGVKIFDKVKGDKSLPILDNIKIETIEGQEKALLTKTNLETTIKIKVDAEIKEDGCILFSSSNLIKKLKENYITITDNEILTDKKKITFVKTDIDDFPKDIIFKESNKIFTTDENEIHKILEVKYAMAQDETRPILQGVCFDGNKTCALDGFRLSIRKGCYINNSNFVVPGEAIKILDSVLSKDNKQVDVYLIDKFVKFEIGDIEVISRLYEGNFIKYESLIPRESDYYLNVNSSEMIEELNFINSINSDKAIKLNFEEKNIKIISQDESNTIESVVDAEYNQIPDFEIGVNSKYLYEALKNIKHEKININMKSKVEPILITNDTDKFELVLPIRLVN